MPIVFAEDFKQDTGDSIMQRYPGSVRGSYSTNRDDAFPVNHAYHLQFGSVPFTEKNSRFEVRMTFEPGTVSKIDGTFQVFGIDFAGTTAGVTIVGNSVGILEDILTMNIVVDRLDSNYQLIVIADDEVLMPPTLLTSWIPTSWIGGVVPIRNPGYGINGLPTWLSSIVVATDTGPGTRLGNVTFTKRQLDVVSPGDWTFTDIGYVEDTDKTDPTLKTPNIGAGVPSIIQYDFTDVVESDLTQLYVSSGSDLPIDSLVVNGVPEAVNVSQRALSVQSTNTPTIFLETREEFGPSNESGVRFLGERDDLITYEQLSAATGVTEGSLNSNEGGNRWLEFHLDGKHLLVSKLPVRQYIGWDHLYSKGLVYGVDGFGTNPTGTPTNQYRTVEINGIEYIVRLLKGGDMDPYTGPTGTYNALGSDNSEWSRLFYPIVTGLNSRYTGPRLAEYTSAALNMGGRTDMSAAVTQETLASNTSVRIYRGYENASYLNIALEDVSANRYYGWRPVLERVQYPMDTSPEVTQAYYFDPDAL